ncbi:MAG: hypothetical protein C0600_08820 [Ignavibacteria bacterium]|nr:MAG: hypothetical protein C0600_08820 [Ignavibacteria bacterium]
MIGLNARSLRQYTKAFQYFREAAELFDGAGNRSGQALVQRDIGCAYFELDRMDKAHDALSSSLKIFRALDIPAEIARALINYAPVLVKQDSPEEAQKLIEEALTISKRLMLAAETAAAQEELGRLHFNAGRYEEADRLLSAAVDARRSLKQKRELSTALVWLAECRHSHGIGEDIEDLLSEAEILAESVGLQQNLLVIANLRAEYAATMGRYGDAHVFWKKYKLLKDSITSVAKDARFQSLLVEFDAERKDYNIAQLTSEREVQRLEMERQSEALRMQHLEARQRVQEIELLSRETEIQQLEMKMTTANLREKEAEATRKQQKINLLEKDRKLRAASLEEQTILRNIFIGSSIAILLIALITIIALRARRRESEARVQAAEAENHSLEVERKQADYEARRSFTRQLIASQEQERKRIAADLHDSLAQELLIINNRVRLSARRDGLDETTANELAGISDAVSTSLREIKNISKALRPFQLDRIGLTTTIESMLRSVNESFDTEFEWEIPQMEGWFTKEQEINIYRTVQEAVNNILKHASAQHASVRIERRNGDLRLEIRDDGSGFDAEAHASPGVVPTGFGLQGMYERVDIMEGNLNIRSAQGNGTAIDIFIPVSGAVESASEQTLLEVGEGGASHV